MVVSLHDFSQPNVLRAAGKTARYIFSSHARSSNQGIARQGLGCRSRLAGSAKLTRQQHVTAYSKDERFILPPDNKFEVDEELWGLLDICSNEELEEVYKILYGMYMSPL